MFPAKAILGVVCASAAIGAVFATPWNDEKAGLEKRARTVTVTQTETVTEVETFIESAGCVQTSEVSDNTSTAVSLEPNPTATSKDAPIATDDVLHRGKCYAVRDVGSFAVRKIYDFSFGNLPADLQISDYSVEDQLAGNPWNHGFSPSNVKLMNGFLNIRVPGAQRPARDSGKAIWGGEVYTSIANILYGSVRTRAVFDATPGTCQGIFSYHDDTGEIDIEYMGDTSSTANPGAGQSPVLWYTNQPGGNPSNQVTGPAPIDIATKVHEYRIDWTKDWTRFYIDGVLQQTLQADVPHVGSQWVWNNWANGSPYWSVGPPKKDNTFKIESITMYYNTTETSNSFCN